MTLFTETRDRFHICLSPDSPFWLFTDNELDGYLKRISFPIWFLLGVVGNTLNLCVLLGPGMHNRANDLLGALAIADMIVILSVAPHAMAAYGLFSASVGFRNFYLRIRNFMVVITNWFSAAAIWLLLAASIERLLVMKSPFRSQVYYDRIKTLSLVVLICLATMLVTSFHYVTRDCVIYTLCNGTQVAAYCRNVVEEKWGTNTTNNHTEALRHFIRVMTVANAFVVVLIPIMILLGINAFLLMLFKKRSHEAKGSEQAKSLRSTLDVGNQKRQELRLTITIIAIVTCFTITQGPSAVVHVMGLSIGQISRESAFVNALVVTNCLVITGKAINLILFCMTSEHFRRRLLNMLTQWLGKVSCGRIIIKTAAKYNGHQTNETNVTTLYRRSAADVSSLGGGTPRRDVGLLSLHDHQATSSRNSISLNQLDIRRIENAGSPTLRPLLPSKRSESLQNALDQLTKEQIS